MKILTQAWFVIAGIVAVPLLLIGLQVIIWFLEGKSVSNLPVYEDVSTLLSEHVSAEEWDSLKHDRRIQILGDIAIFRNDLLVLYSALPDYRSGNFATLENIGAFLVGSQYQFYSIGTEETNYYILVKFNNLFMAMDSINLFILVFLGQRFPFRSSRSIFLWGNFLYHWNISFARSRQLIYVKSVYWQV